MVTASNQDVVVFLLPEFITTTIAGTTHVVSPSLGRIGPIEFSIGYNRRRIPGQVKS